MTRRDILGRGALAGVVLAAAPRALGQSLAGQSLVGQSLLNSSIGVPAVADGLTFYERRVLEIAVRERGRVGASLWRDDIVGVADFAQPSSAPRLHLADLAGGTVRSFLVAHGRGSDPDHDGWLNSFSNVLGSEATSRGAYLSCEWYSGKYGTSIRLIGLDRDNSNALPRAIVIHPAWYVDPAMIARWGKIGRSEGCFAMSPGDFNQALWHLSGGRLLFADRISLA